jgi:hypothetical protein
MAIVFHLLPQILDRIMTTALLYVLPGCISLLGTSVLELLLGDFASEFAEGDCLERLSEKQIKSFSETVLE